MSQFIPVSIEKSQAFEQELENTLFRTPGIFVDTYNKGLVNIRNEEIVNIADRLLETYKDVKNKSNKLVFISKNEVYLDEIIKSLVKWELISKIKREIKDLHDENEIGSEVFFHASTSVGFVLSEQIQDDEQIVYEKVGNEKMFNKIEELVELHPTISLTPVNGDSLYKLNVSEVLGIDDSFIENIYSVVPQ